MTLSVDARTKTLGFERPETLSPRELASVIKQGWKAGETPDAAQAVAEHAALRNAKSLQLDLAYEEYCLRREAGESPNLDSFCARFPSMQASLHRLLAAHQLLEEHPDLISEPAPAWPEPGATFLGFRLRENLGRGAFARVYLAEEPALGDRLVAVKVSLRGAAEAETLGRLRHPSIVPVHSVREDAATGLTAVCMPYLGRATLCDLLDRIHADGKLPRQAQAILEVIDSVDDEEAQVASAAAPDPLLQSGPYADGVVLLGVRLAEALAFAHRLGVYHRDLKPSNVLLSPDGTPLLLDFNLSHDERLSDRRLGGTLPYMPPEQLRATDPQGTADHDEIDARSDLFAFGVILYELLTGKHPFGPFPAASTQSELRDLLLERQARGARPLHRLQPRIDPRVALLVDRCLSLDPEHRPTSADEVVATLRRSLQPLPRARRWLVQRPLVTLTATILLVGVILGGMAAAEGLARSEAKAAEAMLQSGYDAYQAGQYEEAVRLATAAIDQNLNGSTARAYFLRGRARQQLAESNQDRFGLAFEDYFQAGSPEFAGKAAACMGYCLSRQKEPNFGEAAHYFEQARKQGINSAEFWNDYGCVQLQRGATAEALTFLNEALKQKPTLQAALHNRAHAAWQLALSKVKYNPTPKGVVLMPADPAEIPEFLQIGIQDISEAIRLSEASNRGPGPADLYLDAARLYAVSARLDAKAADQALSYLHKAVDLGYDPNPKEPERAFVAIAKDQRFVELQKRLPNAQNTTAVRLLDPLGGSAE
jgi:serine/threonine protein kinase